MKIEKEMIAMFVAASLVGGVATSIAKSWNGNEIYNGKINQREVLYQEGRYTGGNRMCIKVGNIVFDLYDKGGHTFVNENKSDNEKLEVIVITDEKKNKEKYNASDIKEKSLHSEHIAKVFEKCNELYNKTRSEIREKIKEKYQDIEQKILQ